MNLEGKQLIGFTVSSEGESVFQAPNPSTGETLPTQFHKATKAELESAAQKAQAAFKVYRKKSGIEKAIFLEKIAEEIEAIGDDLVQIATAETGLPAGRIQGERGRTTGQLRLFAQLLREGSWVNARIETAIPDRQPLPKVDLRLMQRPLGPVGVFGASNFPLAFSVAGGDTASALAAGCPVIVKAHSAHPGTSELVGRAIQQAALKVGMPDGVFSLLHGSGTEIGAALVQHPVIKAIGFTGSYQGGMALVKLAANRPEPIPVYAEMGSTNPVFILPQIMKEKGAAIAQQFAASVTLGVGQFCTNPGMIIANKSEGYQPFLTDLETQFQSVSGGVMLTGGIRKAYQEGIAKHLENESVDIVAKGIEGTGFTAVQPILFKTDARAIGEDHTLSEEIFGPTSVLVEAESKEEMLRIAETMEGHLTATVHGTPEELVEYADLIDLLEQKVGRLLINGFPTGVEVCHAMMHGGPFPASSDSRSTSVGTAAIYRFTRPVSYQNFPQALLPEELQDSNPLNIWRLVNGEFQKI
ncbi:aldehyde dehydrogenase (NADP(+)) [Runella slithyformis]|uniref:2,5-dioxovalerate dehydrogenase n=1 Tax=Runella slithyformis (strain ATCC 29530 / DSM 19594 / LMG 11500 / NCIMB 11436 / LSU 4) TaxID=761193 RepID=A0A7U3ZRW9_RUNSL|nr:aldehyde dehydrogenase (NADP(+)) [Runella slithyformis]AEI52240.1 Aldehyde dehydrogenase (NADP(+)) [Runella slithyformis DSM 19594]